MMLPVVLLHDRPWLLPPLSSEVIAAALGMGVLATGIAYILYFRILATAGATNLLLVTLLIPVGAVLLGTLVLHEQIEAKHLVGMALIAAGLAAIDGRVLRIFRH
jgi:drug/metabolite transporter (DMT)-like permease